MPWSSKHGGSWDIGALKCLVHRNCMLQNHRHMYKNCINIRSSCVESAVQVVAQLALDEADPRVAAVACWGLAAACHAQRHKKSNANSVGGSNAGAQMRALTGLPEDGAMRALAQIVLTGRHSSFPCLSMLFTSCCASSSFCSSSSFLFFFLFHLLLSSMFPYPACSPCSVDLSACLLCCKISPFQ